MAAQKGDANDRIIQNELAAVWLRSRELLDMKRIFANFAL
jgi:hypothetical protein